MRGLTYLLLILLSLAIVAAMKAVGLILVIAVLITPGATAQLLTQRFDRMIIIAVIVAVGSALAGIYVSYFIDGAPAACIVLVQTLVFLTALLFAPSRGLLRRRPAPASAPEPHDEVPSIT